MARAEVAAAVRALRGLVNQQASWSEHGFSASRYLLSSIDGFSW